ncbi:TVP38/TMEM64 family protein [Kibdelosporangium aridum]|uniref:TVP38/TMEM64 family membrane protein n=1 Tax=Kibdelosporangium aridum TaxID=2030 RepID=A0A428ZU63_KIBAR|nr:TVP38/TMEM64 family protein [Kibdelosporangium aridum]RSM91610.1 TVP38/TMEM64 family protein [Kibdelosporangium aridum]
MTVFLRRFGLPLAGVAIFAAAFLVPGLPVEQVRAWTDAAGPLAPLMFVVIHIVVTILPFPRAVFTLSAGLLFGPVLGIVLAVVAATVSAVLAFLAVRALGRERIAGRLTHPAVRNIDRRLERRGWLAVGSLRLIAAVPFAIVNYCAGLSSVRVLPYVLATVIGILPSTISAAILGDALTGETDPVLLIVSGVFIALGVVGLIVDAKLAPKA